MHGFDRVRGRVRLLVLLVACAAVLAADGTALAQRLDEDPAEPALSLSCLPFDPPHDVAGINTMVAHYRSTPGFVGADVGASVVLQDERALWVFGDTLRQPGFQGQHFVRNSMLMFSPGCATVVMPRDRGAVVPDRADGIGYWPMDLVAVHRDGYDLVGVSLQRVLTTGTGIFDFEILGPSYAIFKVPVGRAPQLELVRDIGADDPDPTRPMWGAAIESAGRWIYLYGTASPGLQVAYGRSLQVARAHPETVGDQHTWQYWDGRSWQHRARRAAVLIPAVNGVSQVLSVFHRGTAWYAVSKRDEMLGTDLVIWKAPGPTGPFTASAPLADIPSNSENGLLRYMPLAHPDLLPSPTSVVVSYSRNVADLDRLMKNPTLYRPRFLQVPLP